MKRQRLSRDGEATAPRTNVGQQVPDSITSEEPPAISRSAQSLDVQMDYVAEVRSEFPLHSQIRW